MSTVITNHIKSIESFVDPDNVGYSNGNRAHDQEDNRKLQSIATLSYTLLFLSIAVIRHINILQKNK